MNRIAIVGTSAWGRIHLDVVAEHPFTLYTVDHRSPTDKAELGPGFTGEAVSKDEFSDLIKEATHRWPCGRKNSRHESLTSHISHIFSHLFRHPFHTGGVVSVEGIHEVLRNWQAGGHIPELTAAEKEKVVLPCDGTITLKNFCVSARQAAGRLRQQYDNNAEPVTQWADAALTTLDAERAGTSCKALATPFEIPDLTTEITATLVDPDDSFGARLIMTAVNMPEPDMMLTYPDGHEAAAMFHYAGEGVDLAAIARANGFEVKWIAYFDDIGADTPDDDYDQDTINAWQPDMDDGWQLAMKFDTDDGPRAILIRKQTDPGEVAA